MARRRSGRIPARLITEIVHYYEQQKPDYEQLQGMLETALRRVKAASSSVHSYSSRLKDPQHLREKLERRWRNLHADGKPFDVTLENLNNKINDLVGGRVLHLHTQQFPEIHAAILDVFRNIGWKLLKGGLEAKVWDPEYKQLFLSLGIPCVAKLSLYTSVHYEFKTPGRKPQLTCELQVRTLAEELWGETDHLINYPQKCAIESCREQILVLARATSTCTRLVDSIMKTFTAR